MPKLLTTPFAAESQLRTNIQESQGAESNSATYRFGFPEETMKKIALGGKPPKGEDMNGVLHDLSDNIVFQTQGGRYKFDPTYANKIGGYPVNAVLQLENGAEVINKTPNNTTNPNVDMTGWAYAAATKDSELMTWSGRTQESKNKGAIGIGDFSHDNDGLPNTDWQKVTSALSYCFERNLSLDFEGEDLLVDGNIPKLWDVDIFGSGSIKTEGGYILKISPQYEDLSTLYVGGTSATNDGLSPENPITIGRAFGILRNLGAAASKGQWRIQLASGTHVYHGINIQNLPYFSKPLQIFGVVTPPKAEKQTKWAGLLSTPTFALRVSHSIQSGNFDIRHIEFHDWSKSSGNSGAFITDSVSQVSIDLCDFNKCDIGAWVLQSYIKVTRSNFTDCKTWGVCAQYQSYGNIGTLSDEYGNTFTRCGISVMSGRNSVLYIQNNDINEIGSYAFEANKFSRIRTQKNRLNSFSDNAISVINLAENALHNDDNMQGSPDIVNLSLSPQKPFIKTWMNGCSSQIHKMQPTYMHNQLDYLNTSYNSAGVRKNLADIDITGHPFRLPAYTLYSTSFSLTVDFYVYVQKDQSLLVELTGESTSLNSRLAYVQTTSAPSNINLKITMRVYRLKSSSSVLFDVEIPALGQYIYSQIVSPNVFDQDSVVSSSENLLRYRLYSTSQQQSTVIFRSANTYVQV